MLWLAVPLGLVIGASLGALGGGGSVLTVPALVYLLDQSTTAATSGSLVIVGITAAAGAVTHWRAANVRLGRGVVFGALGAAGSIVGSRASSSVDPHVLLVAFAGLMFVAAAGMWHRNRRIAQPAPPRTAVPQSSGVPRGVADAVPSRAPGHQSSGGVAVMAPPEVDAAKAPRLDVPCLAKTVVLATVVGLLTGFFGVGGGFVIVPALVLGLGFGMSVAVGTSLVVIAINSAVALATRLHTGVSLDWALLAVFTVAAAAGTYAGSRLAARTHPRRLSTGFAVLLAVLAVFLVVRNLPPLLG